MTRIAIQDANILIDLVEIGLFDICLSLPYDFITSDLIFQELNTDQSDKIRPHILSNKFTIIQSTPNELLDISALQSENDRLSVQDWSAYYYAQKRSAILMTGDRRLRTYAEGKGVEVCGIIRLFDELVGHNIISAQQACQFISNLMSINSRLPKHECEVRKSKWCQNP